MGEDETGTDDESFVGLVTCGATGVSTAVANGSWANVSCIAFNHRRANRKPGPLDCACPSGVCSSVVVGMLVHLEEGWVAWRINGRTGAKSYLGNGWEAGVKIELDGEFGDYVQALDPPWMASILQPAKVPTGLYDAPFTSVLVVVD